jgi:hypothetical protein
MRVLNDTSNPLEYLLQSPAGKGQEPLTMITGSGHEQSSTRVKAPPLLQAI